MIPYKLYAGGHFCDGDASINVINPYTNTAFACVHLAGAKHIEQAILAGLKAEKLMKDLPSYQKSLSLRFIANELSAQKETFAELIVQETAKPLKYALGEVERAIQTYLVAAEECKRIPGEYLSMDWTPAGQGKEGWIKRFPRGLTLGISPFNFPLNLTAHKIAPSIAAGNPIILKPATKTPLSLLKLAEIFDRAGLPKGAISILPMDRKLADQLVVDDRFKVISFTGSPEVGWDLKARCGRKKIMLELGGNAGVYVSSSADIPNAVAKCVGGSFAFSGQVCIHVQRIYVNQSIFTAFVSRFLKATKALKGGDPMLMTTDVAEMIDEGNAARVEAWVKEAFGAGAKILAGGNRNGLFMEPTVLTNTNSTMKVCCEEVFGPVVCLEPVATFDEAMHEINNSKFGLQAGIFTNLINELDTAFDCLEVGGLVHNDVPTFRVDHMPYGGVKNSGTGKEGVKYAIEELTEPKLLVRSL